VGDIDELATIDLRMAQAAPFDAVRRRDLRVPLQLRIDCIHDVTKEIGFIGTVRFSSGMNDPVGRPDRSRRGGYP
jgi:hypothetical protein